MHKILVKGEKSVDNETVVFLLFMTDTKEWPWSWCWFVMNTRLPHRNRKNVHEQIKYKSMDAENKA